MPASEESFAASLNKFGIDRRSIPPEIVIDAPSTLTSHAGGVIVTERLMISDEYVVEGPEPCLIVTGAIWIMPPRGRIVVRSAEITIEAQSIEIYATGVAHPGPHILITGTAGSTGAKGTSVRSPAPTGRPGVSGRDDPQGRGCASPPAPADGGAEGTRGGRGDDGGTGGHARNATLHFDLIKAGDIFIEVSGGTGGTGGKGGDGQQGGRGGEGAPATRYCPQGRGGIGGTGGKGGPGGKGGDGGNGSVVNVTYRSKDPDATIRVAATPGLRGSGGEGGRGGAGGLGGQPGGTEGNTGLEGEGGDPGQPGHAGTINVTQLP